jgi:hypothetical protein
MPPSERQIEDWILQALRDAGIPLQQDVLEKAVDKLSGLAVRMPKGTFSKCLAALLKRGDVSAPLAAKSSQHGGGGKAGGHVYYELSKKLSAGEPKAAEEKPAAGPAQK